MMFDPSEIYRYQTPAIEMCFAMGEQPYESIQLPNGFWVTRWEAQARKMIELNTMIRILQKSGISGA